jgi:hypothetical protein
VNPIQPLLPSSVKISLHLNIHDSHFDVYSLVFIFGCIARLFAGVINLYVFVYIVILDFQSNALFLLSSVADTWDVTHSDYDFCCIRTRWTFDVSTVSYLFDLSFLFLVF